MTTSTGNKPIRSEALFGSIIENVKGQNDARKLATVLVTAYADLVALSNSTAGSELLTSYLYLTDVAVHALSDKVKDELLKVVPGYETDGGVALALVIELVATASTAEELYQKAALPRNSDIKTLTGFEDLNEAQIVRVYGALNQQTKGILVNNGIDTQGAWATKLLVSAPTLDKLVQMDFGTMHGILTGLTGTSTAYEQATVHKIYAGMTSGIPTNVQIPPVRKHILISGLSMFVADELEKMGKPDLSHVDKSAFSGLIDQSLKKLVAKKVPFERYSDRVISNDDAKAFRKKMQQAWQLSLKDASHKGNKKHKELSAEEKEKIKEMMKSVEKERKDLLEEVSTLLETVDTDSNTILEEQREKVKKLIIDLESKSSLKPSPMQGMEKLSKRLSDMLTLKDETDEDFVSTSDMLTLKAYDTNEELVSNVYGGAALKGIGIFVDDDETIVVPSRTLLKKPLFAQLSSPALPFRTVTERSTNESSMHSFIASSLSSSYGTAKKTKSSASASYDTTFFKGGLAVVNNSNSSGGVSNNSGSVDEEILNSTEACVSEFTFMPMKSFSRSEGSFELSDEAYGRLEKINDPQGALDFLKRFGSHIPMGNQTLGGVFIRTMRITSRDETKISDLYDAASVQLSETNATAAAANAQTAGLGNLFSSASIKISHARSSSYTTMGEKAHNKQDSTVASNATFDSNVICHGPNAVDQDSFYEQLAKSNATWAVIDRGDTNTYFSIWELIEFMNLTSFEKQCKLLKAQWMRMALDNYSKYPRDQKLLIDLWQSSAASSAEASAFVKALIDCLIPIKLAPFDNVLAGQFQKVVISASALQNAVPALTPTQFIDAGFAAMTINNTNQLFRLVEGTPEYELASAQMLTMTKMDFMEFGNTYKKQKNTKLILAKAENQYLANLCRSYSESVETNWDYFKELVFPSDSNGATDANKDAFNDRLKEQLMTPEATENKYLCLHYLMNNQEDDTLFKRILLLRPEVLVATDSASENLFDYDQLQHENDNIRKLWDELTLVNVARGRVATGNVDETRKDLVASNAVNGSTYGSHIGSKLFFHSSNDVDQKWSVDLVNSFDIEQIKIYNRNEKQYHDDMNNFKVHVLNDGIEQWSIDVDKIEDVWTHTLPRGVSGDEVKITRNNSNNDGGRINLAEVEVYSRNLRNVAFGKKADQSSYLDEVAMPASNAVNGVTSGTHNARNIVHTAENEETDQYWEVDLDGSYSIESIHVYNRSEDSFQYQLNNFKVEVFDENNVQKYSGERQDGPKPSTVFFTPKDTVGNRVKISRDNVLVKGKKIKKNKKKGFVVLAEVQVFARP